MRDAFIQIHWAGQEAQVDEVVEQLDAVDLALGQYLSRESAPTGTRPVFRRRTCARTPRWYRARIAEWCRDPAVRTAYGTEAVVSTALALPHLSDDELLLFVYDLTERASVALDRRPRVPRPRRRAG